MPRQCDREEKRAEEGGGGVAKQKRQPMQTGRAGEVLKKRRRRNPREVSGHGRPYVPATRQDTFPGPGYVAARIQAGATPATPPCIR